MHSSLWPTCCALMVSAFLATLVAAAPGHAQSEGYLVPAPASDNIKKNPDYECEQPIAPVISLDTQSKYKQTDASKAVIDESANENYSEAVEPLRNYSKGLVKAANAYVRSDPKNPAAAACALSWLDAWAEAGAMTAMNSKQASFNQGQSVAGFALAYLQIRNAPGLPDDRKKRVESWLNKLGHQVVAFMDPNTDVSGKNNHRYWSGLSATAAGIATDDKRLIHWGIDSARIGLAQIDRDGILPLELERAQRARDYHVFAAAPLVATAALAHTQGIDLYGEKEHALARLVNRIVDSFDDPSFFEKTTGKKQEAYSGDGTVPANRIAWLEIYGQRFPSPKIEALLAPKRPVASSDLGGNLTLLFRGKE
jgi:poly(beta-D-mannuronate) lyase